MKFLRFFASICAVSCFVPNNPGDNFLRFSEWKQKYRKTSLDDSSTKNFFENLEKIDLHNRQPDQTYELGLNENSHLSTQERLFRSAGIKVPRRVKRATTVPARFVNNKPLPCYVNYTSYFPVIKNQGACLSCWAFAAVSVIEYFMWKMGKKWEFSEQDLVDCSKANFGCMGGWATNAFKYIKDEGISNGTKYPYTGQRQDCQKAKQKYKPILKIRDVCEIFLNGDEDTLKRIIAQYGPVSGAIYTTEAFLSYKGGVFNDIRCSNHTVDHAVTIVGYGTDYKAGDFWIIRNSWGTSWGMQGYAMIARNRNSVCAIALYAVFPC